MSLYRLLQQRAAAGRPVRVGLIGAGKFGSMFLNQVPTAPGLEVPVIAKEVGWGISERTARLLADCGVSAIDVAGAGGTSWSQVEMHRAPDEFTRQLAATFVGWGIPTAESILNVKKVAPDMTIFASGGLKDGLDIAKCIALGATLGGMAGQFLKAAAVSTEKAVEMMQLTKRQIEVSMFACGVKGIRELEIGKLMER